MERGRRSAIWRTALALAGVALIGALFWRIGWGNVQTNLRAVGPWLFCLVALNFVAQASFVLGLRSVLPRGLAWPPFAALFGTYMQGDAANYLAPGGGDLLKARLLSRSGGGTASTVAVTLHKHAELFAQCAIVIAGLSVALLEFNVPRALAGTALFGAFLLVAFLCVATWALRRGAFTPVLAVLERWKRLAPFVGRFRSAAAGVDQGIRDFHSRDRRRFAASVGFCLLGWCGGFLETWAVLTLLGARGGWARALAIESLAIVLNSALVFIPGKLGGSEGVRTGVFVVLGLSAAQGAASSLIRRTTELLWILPGWVLLLRQSAAPKRAG